MTHDQPTVLHLFAGMGGGGLGFARAGFRCVGAIDSDPAACRDFELLVGFPATCADLSTMTPGELANVTDGRPDVVFSSPPCKGFSGCLPSSRAATEPYVDMNSLAMRGIWLSLEAWPVPPPLIVLENVPRIQSRGAHWLDQIEGLLRAYGYAVARSTHDCGELGGLAQHRRRFLLVARHMPQVPAFVHVPPKRRVRAIGEVLEELTVPIPGSTTGGPMHRLPRLSAMNWVRLALIPAGGDWRALPPAVALPARAARQNGPYGVDRWDNPSHAVLGHHTVRDTWGGVGDPRMDCEPRAGVLGVIGPDEPANAVIGSTRPDNGSWSVADPRVTCQRREGGHGVKAWEQPSAPVIGHPSIDNFPAQVADPRIEANGKRHNGTLGVQDWAQPGHAVLGSGRTSGWGSVSDPRVPVIAGPPIDIEDRRPTYLVIRAIDGTWHRPLTTLELAALQGFPIRQGAGWLDLDGSSHRAWRERIGNAVPPPAAEAIGRSCAASLAAASKGFQLDAEPIWVRRRKEASV